MCRRTIYDARNNFSALVKMAEEGEAIELTRHDKPVAVIISYEEYEKQGKKRSFFDRWNETRMLFADVFSDPDFEGLPLPEDDYPDQDYDKKIIKMWSEE